MGPGAITWKKDLLTASDKLVPPTGMMKSIVAPSSENKYMGNGFLPTVVKNDVQFHLFHCSISTI